MSEKKRKKEFFKFFFNMGFGVDESKKLSYQNLITCKDLATFQNPNMRCYRIPSFGKPLMYSVIEDIRNYEKFTSRSLGIPWTDNV